MWGQEDQWHPAQPRENHLGDCFFQQFWPMVEKNGNKIFLCPRGYELVFGKKYFAKIKISNFEEIHEMLRLCVRGGHTD